jgi:hypothetical protein
MRVCCDTTPKRLIDEDRSVGCRGHGLSISGKITPVGIRNQPLRIVVVVGLWAMWVLWTITRFTSTVIVTLPTTTTCPRLSCAATSAVGVNRQFNWSWWHFLFALIGAALLVAASVMILRTPRSVDEL